MEKFIVSLFSDTKGTISSMRVMCFLALFVAIVCTVYGIIKHDINIPLISIWVGVAFGGKTVQKITEGKSE